LTAIKERSELQCTRMGEKGAKRTKEVLAKCLGHISDAKRIGAQCCKAVLGVGKKNVIRKEGGEGHARG